MNKDSKPSKVNIFISMAISATIIAIVKRFWPEVIPLEVFGPWRFEIRVMNWLEVGLPLLGWGVLLQTVFEILRSRRKNGIMNRFEDRLAQTLGVGPTPAKIFVRGLFASLYTGVTEEIAFRWLLSLSVIVGVKISNFLFFGFAGFGLIEWLFIHLFRPLADFTTSYQLHGQLFHLNGWSIGAAMLAANATFRDGHKYQSWVGYVNSWFCGMFLFWMMYNHGIVAAILIHTLYNVVIYAIIALGTAWRNQRQRPFGH